MKLTAALLSCAALLLLYVPAASAQDNDPAFFSDGSNCAVAWCASVNLDATDPISSETGLVEYILKTSGVGSDPSVVTGDADITDGYVLRFEMSGGTPEVFVLKDPVAAYNTSDGAEANPLSEAPVPASWTPGVGQVGYDSDAGHTGQTYGFVLVTPEPASVLLLGAGLGLLGLGARKRLRAK